MELMFLDPTFVPLVGSLVAGGLLVAMVVGAVVYGWLVAKSVRPAEVREPLELKKAA